MQANSLLLLSNASKLQPAAKNVSFYSREELIFFFFLYISCLWIQDNNRFYVPCSSCAWASLSWYSQNGTNISIACLYVSFSTYICSCTVQLLVSDFFRCWCVKLRYASLTNTCVSPLQSNLAVEWELALHVWEREGKKWMMWVGKCSETALERETCFKANTICEQWS